MMGIQGDRVSKRRRKCNARWRLHTDEAACFAHLGVNWESRKEVRDGIGVQGREFTPPEDQREYHDPAYSTFVKKSWNYMMSEGANEESWRDFTLWMLEHFHHNICRLPDWECVSWKLGANMYFSSACVESDTDDMNNFPIRVAKYFDDEMFLGSVINTRSIKNREGIEERKLHLVLYDDKDEEDFDDDELKEGRDLLQKYLEEQKECHPKACDKRYVEIVTKLWNIYKTAARGGGGLDEQAKVFGEMNLWMAENFHYNVARLHGWERESGRIGQKRTFIWNYKEYIGNLFEVTIEGNCGCRLCTGRR